MGKSAHGLNKKCGDTDGAPCRITGMLIKNYQLNSIVDMLSKNPWYTSKKRSEC